MPSQPLQPRPELPRLGALVRYVSGDGDAEIVPGADGQILLPLRVVRWRASHLRQVDAEAFHHAWEAPRWPVAPSTAPQVPTPLDWFAETRSAAPGVHRWPLRHGTRHVASARLWALLGAAYDPADPRWHQRIRWRPFRGWWVEPPA